MPIPRRAGMLCVRFTRRLSAVRGVRTVFFNPDVIAATVGSFADPTFPPPQYTVYNARRHAWAEMPALAGVDTYD
jgi:hypothetical protein